jgi:hypothetical protein
VIALASIVGTTTTAGASTTVGGGYIIDGLDISHILFADYANNGAGSGATAGHECYFFYKYAVAADAANALAAVRCGDHKAYYLIDKGPPAGTAEGNHSAAPVLFNLVTDPGENKPVKNDTVEYTTALAAITKARTAHLASIDPYTPNQNGRGSDAKYAICGAPESTKTTPQWPNCTKSPENWAPVEICSNPACLKANGGFKVGTVWVTSHVQQEPTPSYEYGLVSNTIIRILTSLCPRMCNKSQHRHTNTDFSLHLVALDT